MYKVLCTENNKHTYNVKLHIIKKTKGMVHSSSFHEPGRISTSQGKQYCTNKDFMRQNWTVHQMNDSLLVKFM